MRTVALWLILLAAVAWALWPAVSPRPIWQASDACAAAQLRYEAGRARLGDVLRACGR